MIVYLHTKVNERDSDVTSMFNYDQNNMSYLTDIAINM